MIEIMNLNNNKPSEPYDFYVDRRTPVGNPEYLYKEDDRDTVCEKYKTYFNKMISITNPNPSSQPFEFHKYLSKLIDTYKKYGMLRLFCWCSPKRCHSETIKDYILKNI